MRAESLFAAPRGSFRIVLSADPFLYGAPDGARRARDRAFCGSSSKGLASQFIPESSPQAPSHRRPMSLFLEIWRLFDTRQGRGFTLVPALAPVMAVFTLARVAAVVLL